MSDSKATEKGWSEAEIKSAIKAYFVLLDAENTGQKLNKTEIYRELSRLHPKRSPKAFESKFQNISAVLEKERYPFVSGLKPLRNYQKLMELMVLDHLNSSNPKGKKPKEILLSKLKRISDLGFVPVRDKGTGRFGHTLETLLLIPKNSSKEADFMGIEIKTKETEGNTLQTLFSRVPSRFVGVKDRAELVKKYGYVDQKRGARLALYTSFGANPNSLGFQLKVAGNCIQVIMTGEVLLEYDFDTIEEALISKHSEVVFVEVQSRKTDSSPKCKFGPFTYCRTPSFRRFLSLLGDGKVHLDFTLSLKNGKAKDHGFLWRIRVEEIQNLYFVSEKF